MRKLELDDQGKLNIGPVGGVKTGKINVAFDSADTSGIALSVEASPAAGSERAGNKLGGFFIGQDPQNDGDAAGFGIADRNGVLLDFWAEGIDKLAYITYIDAFTTGAIHASDASTGMTNADVSGVLAALPEGSATGLIVARVNALVTAFIAHGASEASRYVLAAHWNADGMAGILSLDPATDLATACTNAIALGSELVTHAAGETGGGGNFHFYPDATLAAFTPSSDLLAGNATGANCITVLNEILTAMFTHAQETAGVSSPLEGVTQNILIPAVVTLRFVNGRLMSSTPEA